MIKDLKMFLKVLADYYKEDNQTTLQVTLDWLKTQNLTMESLNKLYNQILQNEKYFPRIVDLQNYIQKPGDIEAIQAYRIAFNVARNYGTGRSAYFANNRIAQTIKLGWGSWEAFGRDNQPDHFRQKEFMDIFERTRFENNKESGFLIGIYKDDYPLLVEKGASPEMIEIGKEYLEENMIVQIAWKA